MTTRRKQEDRLPLMALNSDPNQQDDATSKNRRRRPHKLCLRFIAVAAAIYVLQFVYYKVELLMDDPEKEGMYFMPVRYFSAKLWEKAPATAAKTFHLRPEYAWNLTRTQRWKRFQTTGFSFFTDSSIDGTRMITLCNKAMRKKSWLKQPQTKLR
jgi:hypothetical protein